MKVKIIKCSDRENSYGHLVGKVFEVHNSNHMLCVIVDGNCVYNISNKDTIPVNEIRYEIRDSKKIIKSCITSCEHIRDTSVGSWACEKCEHNCGIDKVNQIVLCSWQVGDTVVIEGFKDVEKSYVEAEGDEMKRLDIRKDYEDSKIEIVTCCSDRGLDYSRVRLLNDSDIKIIMRIGEKYSITLNQVNAILKVMGLDYELYEMDWSKVEVGAEVVFWLTCGNLKGQVRGKFNSYIPNLKKVIVIVDDEVNVVDEDEVELV